MSVELPSPPGSGLPPALQLAFAPVHKRAFGMATGTAAGLLVSALTVVHLLRSPHDPYPLSLLGEFFYGYVVSWRGVVIGAFWAGVAGRDRASRRANEPITGGVFMTGL